MEKRNKNSFFAIFFRQKYIRRWGLMRNTTTENLLEHAAEVASVSHALAVIGNKYFGRSYDENRAAVLALYHDVPEVYTGDLPTPVKYANANIRSCYAEIENNATEQIVSRLPIEMQEYYSEILTIHEKDAELKKLIKAADKLCALIKCMEEEKGGNYDFSAAKEATEKALRKNMIPELEYFIEHFLPSFTLTVDEL